MQRQISRGIPRESPAVRIELRLIEIVTVFIRFAPGEDAAFNFDIAPDEARSGNAEREMRRILPMMSDRRRNIARQTPSLLKLPLSQIGLYRVEPLLLLTR
ncbi:MAG: hypothetical protein DMF26_11110 [Verrucomicrobia bacterium]|nr:MAG: hypothetical protein DMF26_11110 [Verrucomicrobiota bacterium]